MISMRRLAGFLDLWGRMLTTGWLQRIAIDRCSRRGVAAGLGTSAGVVRRISVRRRKSARLSGLRRLKMIRLAVSKKLQRVYRQSSASAADAADEMVDQAYIEYAEKPPADQKEVRNLVGLLITTAVRRSIDKARREGREINGEGAQALIDKAEDQAPSTETLAIQGIAAADVREVMGTLTAEQRRALALYYWAELSTRKPRRRWASAP
jgi:DNA-directed RNA polymerase specialized sigma24 family protein